MKSSTNNKKGFTIIEVMIVLAIAGIIMLVVFLAVPALQRNSRNTQRRNDVQHFAGVLNEFKANHSGKAPATVNGTPGATNLDLSGENFSIMTSPIAGTGSGTAVSDYAGATPPTGATATLDAFYVYSGAKCTPDATGATAGGGDRSLVILFSVEPSTLQCIAV